MIPPLIEHSFPEHPGLRVQAIEPKPSAFCSNTYLVATDEFLLAIDPGGEESQALLLAERITAEWRNTQRPLLVLLTHCHRDHSRGLEWLREKLGKAMIVAAHPAGAEALSRGDRFATISYLYNEDAFKTTVDWVLFQESSPSPWEGSRSVVKQERLADDEHALCQRIWMGAGRTPICLYHLPGHSPDSLIIQVGPALFLGDLLFAANPGIAGAAGWDRTALETSVRFVRALIRAGGLHTCYSGHGSALPAQEALPLLDTLEKQVRKLGGIMPMDSPRARFLKRYAIALLQETEVLLTIAAGRLFKLASALETLEENEASKKLLALLDVDRIENLLAGFQQFAQAFLSNQLETLIPLKGLQVMGRLQALFNEQRLQPVMEARLLRRIAYLLCTLSQAVYGLEPMENGTTTDARQVISNLLHVKPAHALDVLSFPDAPEDFLQALVSQMAFHAPWRGMPIELEGEPSPLPVAIPEAALEGLLAGLFERLAVAGAPFLRVRAVPNGAPRALEFHAPWPHPHPCDLGNMEYITLELERFSATWTLQQNGTELQGTLVFQEYSRTA